MTHLTRPRLLDDSRPFVLLRALWFALLTAYLLTTIVVALWEHVPEGAKQAQWTTGLGLAATAGLLATTAVVALRRTRSQRSGRR